nr:PREDICTED: DOMON domain-containing protein FRRS1L [Pelecanus crispus]
MSFGDAPLQAAVNFCRLYTSVLANLPRPPIQLMEAVICNLQHTFSFGIVRNLGKRIRVPKRLRLCYPFPTAPPVDPFAKIRVDDCGKTKGCFRYGKPGCNAETCDYFLSYRRIGADVEFELSADTDGWVAVGFSSDKKMGGDDVMACVHDDNGRVRIQHFYNVGQWAKEIQRNPARDEEGVFENNRVTCRFKRPVYVPREETIVDLHLSWYYLFAWGPAIQGSITRHDIDSPPVSERVVSIYKYEDIFMPSAAYQTFSSPFCLLLIVALTFYLLMGTP